MLQPRLCKVEPRDNFILYLLYETGEKKLFDVKPYISGSWYGKLNNPAYFQTVKLLPDGSGIEWLDGQDIAPHELYDLGEIVS